MTTPSPIKVGFISYGHSTRTFHIPFILPSPSYAVAAFLQRNDVGTESRSGKPAPHCEIDFPNARRYRDMESFMRDGEIQLVVVASHTDSHGLYAEAAMRAGKDVVVEKAFTSTSQEADKLIEIAKATGRLLTVYQNRRYDSDFLTLCNVLSANALGKLTEFEVHYDIDSPPWTKPISTPDVVPGTGYMFGVGVHIMDQVIVLFGRPSGVTAFYRSLRGVKSRTDDAFTIVLQYEGEGKEELLVTVKGTNVSRLPNQLRYFVRGYEGTFLKWGEDPQTDQLRKFGMSSTDPAFGWEDPELYGILTTGKKVLENQKEVNGTWVGAVKSEQGSYHRYYEDLARKINREEGGRWVDPRDSRDGIRILELARESAETGRTVRFE